MTWMFEVYYKAPTDPAREDRLLDIVRTHGGQLDYREHLWNTTVCLTYEFESLPGAEAAQQQIRALGEHVEGISRYS